MEEACAKALEAEAVSVPLIGRMVERGTQNQPTPATPAAGAPAAQGAKTLRFARDPGHFATKKPSRDNGKPNRDNGSTEQPSVETEGGVA